MFSSVYGDVNTHTSLSVLPWLTELLPWITHITLCLKPNRHTQLSLSLPNISVQWTLTIYQPWLTDLTVYCVAHLP